ncbi:cupin domain-containing protein [Paludisphaera rhizosphaerae]|uniref:cupin n=1 Tax=Paludisphaera rhizosphaerae TaxID=2711216 RepID=UPI0013EE2B25|nr:cupin [Paludisphaera rhizosphaerae]
MVATTTREKTADEVSELTRDGQYFEYSRAADPIGAGIIPPIPFADFPASLHEQGPTGIIPLDLSEKLGQPGPATSPSLLASFMHILPGESIRVRPNASSQLYYVMRGRGRTDFGAKVFPWSTGDFVTLPAGDDAVHFADEDAALYWVHDEPMVRYLGAKVETPTFRPTLYPAAEARAELARAEADPHAKNRNRVSVLLANKSCPLTRTVTPTLWAMFGILPVAAVQAPHRHQSVALDLILDAKPGCYTLVGQELGADGRIVDPIRVDWHSASAFVTPPGLWHSHYNESGVPAYLLPIQDAGLQTYLRTLDIQFGRNV